MKKYIHIQKTDREFIAKLFGITERTIFNAIHFEDMSEGNELAKKIRKVALERGGIVMVEAPETEVLHDADGYMRYYISGGILLEFSKKASWEFSCTLSGLRSRRRSQESAASCSAPGILEHGFTASWSVP